MSSGGGPIENFQHHPEFWFSDGNIVILAETMAFRLHQGVLSRHSEVFRDMFSFPQPEISETNAPSLDGVPMVHVSDSAEDFVCLVNTLYDRGRSSRSLTSRDPLPFPVISAHLRLGAKYQIESLREHAIHRLRICFPSQQQDYDGAMFDSTISSQSVKCGWKPISLFRNDAIEVVNLARSFDVPELMPCAAYVCTLTSCLP